MVVELLFIFIGLIALILGGEFLVRGASRIALRARLSPLVVGLTIVAFGTSAPELLISIRSALMGSPDLTMGNVIGSNICNLALVLGVTGIISPIKVNTDTLKIDWPMTMGSSLLLYFLVREGIVDSNEGLFFILLLIAYTVFIIWKSRRQNRQVLDPTVEEVQEKVDPSNKSAIFIDLLLLALGATGLYFGSEWFVKGAQSLAEALEVPERIIGLTVLALGTSLPELVTAVVAAMRKQTDIALGNLMGSNIFNILSILGITSLIQEIHVNEEIVDVDIIWMLGITLILFPFMLWRRTFGRVQGFFMLFIYLIYAYNLIF